MDIKTVRQLTVKETADGFTYTGEVWVNASSRVYNGTIFVNEKVNNVDQRVAECYIVTNNPAQMGVNTNNEVTILKTVKEYKDNVLLQVVTVFNSMVAEVESKAASNQL